MSLSECLACVAGMTMRWVMPIGWLPPPAFTLHPHSDILHKPLKVTFGIQLIHESALPHNELAPKAAHVGVSTWSITWQQWRQMPSRRLASGKPL